MSAKKLRRGKPVVAPMGHRALAPIPPRPAAPVPARCASGRASEITRGDAHPGAAQAGTTAPPSPSAAALSSYAPVDTPGQPPAAEIAELLADRQRWFPLPLLPQVLPYLYPGESVALRTAQSWVRHGIGGIRLGGRKRRRSWLTTVDLLCNFMERSGRAGVSMPAALSVVVGQSSVQRAIATRVLPPGMLPASPPRDGGALLPAPPPIAAGLLARRLAPLAEEGQDYSIFLNELIDEYRPQTRQQSNLVVMLAAQLVRLGQVSRSLDELMAPGPAETHPQDRLTVAGTPAQEQEFLALLRRLELRLAAGQPFALEEPEAQQMAHAIDLAVTLLEAEQAAPPAPPASRRGRTASAGRVPARHRAAVSPGGAAGGDGYGGQVAYQQIQPRTLGLTDPVRLHSILTGRHPIAASRRPRWQALLQYLRQMGHVRLQQAEALAAAREGRRRQQQLACLTANHRKIQDLLKLEESLYRAMQRTRIQLLNSPDLRG